MWKSKPTPKVEWFGPENQIEFRPAYRGAVLPSVLRPTTLKMTRLALWVKEATLMQQRV